MVKRKALTYIRTDWLTKPWHIAADVTAPFRGDAFDRSVRTRCGIPEYEANEATSWPQNPKGKGLCRACQATVPHVD